MLRGYKRLLALSALMSGSSPVEDTATGNPVAFATELAKPLKSLLIPFTPQQEGSGDPSPSNIRPIVPWDGVTVKHGGKNLLNVTPYGGVFFNVETGTDLAKTTSRATYTQNGNEITVTTESAWYGCVFATGVLPSGTYNVHTETSETNCKLSSYITDDDLIVKERKAITSNNIIITLVEPSRIAVVISNQSTGTVVATNVQVESGSVFTTYEPYKPITETDISFPSPVYGGTLDVVSGVLTVEWGIYEPTGTEGVYIEASNNRIAFAIPNEYRTQDTTDVYCTHFKTQTAGAYCYITTSMTVDELKAFFANNSVKIACKLATPQEIQLTPSQITALVGNNTLWSDANGDMIAVYFKKA